MCCVWLYLYSLRDVLCEPSNNNNNNNSSNNNNNNNNNNNKTTTTGECSSPGPKCSSGFLEQHLGQAT